MTFDTPVTPRASYIFRRISGGLCAFIWALAFSMSCGEAKERQKVIVGAYEYGVIFFYEDGEPAGLATEIVRALNEVQDTYLFEFAETSSRRRYRDIQEGQIDIVLLENPGWDWENYDVDFSDAIVRESDLYVVRRNDSQASEVLANVTSHSILAVLGFHYGFAHFNANPDYLRDNFDVHLRYNEQEVLDSLIAREGRVGIVSAGFLARSFALDPGLHQHVTVGETADASYDLVSVVSRQAPIAAGNLSKLINKLQETKVIDQTWEGLRGRFEGTAPDQ
ncbi:hypothetical protein LPB41_07380 [Thalassospira sp. MA62]|nr:hypothetical protein [Thalassospira sp. MA62]